MEAQEGPSDADSAFSREQYSRAYPDGVGATYWHVARKRILLRKLRPHARSGRLLDVGCGTGDVVDALRHGGFDAYGAEISRAPVPARLAAHVFSPADARELPEPFRVSIATLTLLDVLEHLTDPVEMLRSLLRAFPQATTVVLTLPAREELWSNFDEYYGHHRRYDLAMAAKLLTDAGLRVSEVGYFFHALYWPMWLTSRVGVARSLEIRPPRALLLHDVVARVLEWDERLLPRRWSGSSVLAIGTRTPT